MNYINPYTLTYMHTHTNKHMANCHRLHSYNNILPSTTTGDKSKPVYFVLYNCYMAFILFLLCAFPVSGDFPLVSALVIIYLAAAFKWRYGIVVVD